VGDALDDRQAEADTCVVGAYAFGAAPKRLGQRGNHLWGELFAGVLDGEQHAFGVDAGTDSHRTVFGQVVDDRVVYEVRGQLQQERVGADAGGDIAGGLDGDAVRLREGAECFGRLFRSEGKACEDCAAVPHRRGSDPGQGMTTVSCVRYVDPGRCGALVRAGQTDLT
jgi:hypothetical protein